jgi:hypothetical protein
MHSEFFSVAGIDEDILYCMEIYLENLATIKTIKYINKIK